MRVLGIDTSNYTTSIALVENGKILKSSRRILNVKCGERGLRQSEALFQHIKNLPVLMENMGELNPEGVCVSTRPRSVEGSYMPVFKAGECVASCIASTYNIPMYTCSHQEGHIEAAYATSGMDCEEFCAFHISGGTSEVLHITRKDDYSIEKVGGSRDISLGQFIDRIGVASGIEFPCGACMDKLALASSKLNERIPTRVDGTWFNLSGQETYGVKMIESGYNQSDISYIAFMCVAKTIEKLLSNTIKEYNLPVLITGGVACSEFVRQYIKLHFKCNNIYFGNKEYSSDNAVGTALIGYNKMSNKKE